MHVWQKGPGKEAKLSYMGHTVMESRNGLVVNAAAGYETGKTEREIATTLLAELPAIKSAPCHRRGQEL